MRGWGGGESRSRPRPSYSRTSKRVSSPSAARNAWTHSHFSFRSIGAHRSYPLSRFFDLPAGDEGEADIEGLHVDAAGDWLWITGSHSRKRKRPRPDAAASPLVVCDGPAPGRPHAGTGGIDADLFAPAA